MKNQYGGFALFYNFYTPFLMAQDIDVPKWIDKLILILFTVATIMRDKTIKARYFAIQRQRITNSGWIFSRYKGNVMWGND